MNETREGVNRTQTTVCVGSYGPLPHDCGQRAGDSRSASLTVRHRQECLVAGSIDRLVDVDGHLVASLATLVHELRTLQRNMNDNQQSQPSTAVEYTEFTLGTKTISLISDPDNPRAWLKSDVTTVVEQ